MTDNSHQGIKRELPFVEREGRVYVDVMALEVLMSDFSKQLKRLRMDNEGRAIDMLTDSIIVAVYGPKAKRG
jgi:hypothetical protein